MARARINYTPLIDPDTRTAIPGVYTQAGERRPAPAGFPDEVRIHGVVYRVWYHSRIFSARAVASRLAGCVNHYWRTIVIDPDQPRHEVRDTLIHEMAHVYVSIWRGRADMIRELTAGQEEAICQVMADALADAMANNDIP